MYIYSVANSGISYITRVISITYHDLSRNILKIQPRKIERAITSVQKKFIRCFRDHYRRAG